MKMHVANEKPINILGAAFKACEQLGIISKSFPTVGEILHTCNLKELSDDLPQPMGE